MMNEMKTGIYIHGEENYAFNFYTNLTTAKKLRFVNSIVDLLVDKKHYNSVIRDIIFDFYTIKYFTDINVYDLEHSESFLDDVEVFLLETNIVEIVKANAFPTLFDELNKAVDDSISYLTGIHKNPINDALSSLVSTIERKIDEVDLNSMMGMAQKFASMTGELTPESVMNAYINSDVHKQNLAEIAAAKKKDGEYEVKADDDLGEAVRTVVEDEVADNVINFADKK